MKTFYRLKLELVKDGEHDSTHELSIDASESISEALGTLLALAANSACNADEPWKDSVGVAFCRRLDTESKLFGAVAEAITIYDYNRCNVDDVASLVMSDDGVPEYFNRPVYVRLIHNATLSEIEDEHTAITHERKTNPRKEPQ